VICYHTTDAANTILAEGFRDTTGSYMLHDFELTGVWLADRPLNCNQGAKGDQVLRVELPDDLELREIVELDEDGNPAIGGYREWDVPAALINEHATVTLMSDDELDAEAERRWRLAGWLPPEE
jgi:hypothetical protein